MLSTLAQTSDELKRRWEKPGATSTAAHSVPQEYAWGMKAWTHREYGGPEVMRLTEAALPAPEPHEVLVRVEAVSINPVDWKIMASHEKAANFGLALPSGIANDIAGTIEEVGSSVTLWKVGDRVMTSARGRALQEYVVIDPSSVAVAHIPEQLDTAEAACVNIAARTAWDAVEGPARARAGQTLLVHGGSGAVGQFAIQFARRHGVRVVATASASRLGRVRSLGAEAVEYGGDLHAKLQSLAPINAVLDCADGEGVRVGIELGAELHRCISISVKNAHGAGGVATDLEQTAPLQHLIDMVAAGDVEVEIGARYPFARAREAYEAAIAGQHKGKIVIEVG